MKPFKFCVHGDGNPVCPPSLVLCRECLDGISNTFSAMISKMEPPTKGLPDEKMSENT